MKVIEYMLIIVLSVFFVFLFVFLLWKTIREIRRRVKGLENDPYDEDAEVPLGMSSRFFASAFFSKFLFQLISVKVWGLVAATAISTWLALKNFPRTIVTESGSLLNINEPILNGVQWTTFNTTIWALIFGMKEVFKVVDQRSKRDSRAEKELQEERAEQNLKLAEAKAKGDRIILSQVQAAEKPHLVVDSEGHEIVGDDPE